ncbi:MAG: TauD/TfdA family dioxygenase [Burkholderiales bacterium]
MPAFTLVPLSSALGAQVIGLDLKGPISADTAQALIEAWHEHVVLLFRGQHLNFEEHIAFSRTFGELDDHASIPTFRHPDHPEVLLVTNYEANGTKLAVGRQWHSDLSTTTRPAKGSMLRCETLPPAGGDTMFCNMVKAWDNLSPAMRSLLEGRNALHDMAISRETQKVRTPGQIADIRRRNPPVWQPIARQHDDTGRRALYVSEMTTVRIDGLHEGESDAILNYLYAHSTLPENVYRHRWQVGDLLLWDNRSAMHIALADYELSATRVMYRTTLLGEPSGIIAT